MTCEIIGIGSYVPTTVLTNDIIENMRPSGVLVEDWTDDAWIVPRTGIKERRVAGRGVGSADLMVRAAQAALVDAGLGVEEIDLIITSSSFADMGFNAPRTSELLKQKLRAPQHILSLEENAACAGFCFALERAKLELLAEPEWQTVLVVSGDKVTAATDYEDRNTCILFGDAAGAVVLRKNNIIDSERGLIVSLRETDTYFINAIVVPAGGSILPANHETVETGQHFLKMPGGGNMLKEIGGKKMPELCRRIAELGGVKLEEIRHIIPHQANLRILEMAERKLGLHEGVVFKDNVALFGNTSGSSIPLALDTLYRQGKLEPDDLIILIGFGAGFTFGANLIRWTKRKYKGGIG